MKILLITGIYPPEIGGPATFVPQFAKHLVNCGHQVTVLTLRKRKINHKVSQYWKTEHVPAFSWLPVRVLATVIKIVLLAKKHDYLFSNGLYIESGLALTFLKRKSMVKVVGNPIWERSRNRNKLRAIYKGKIDSPSKLQKFESRILVFALNRFTFVTCPSSNLCDDVKEWGIKRNPIFIPNGVTIREPAESTKDIDVITVSRLVSWKNIDVLIQSCANLGTNLWIIGDGPEMQKLKNLADRLQSKVVFLGELPTSDVPEYLDRSKCFVLISDFEGLSFALLEAMNSRVPVVVSNVPGNRSVVKSEKFGQIVGSISPKDVQEKISKIMNSNNSIVVENAHELVKKNYDLKITFQKIMEIMESK